jgi:hypothetical protein
MRGPCLANLSTRYYLRFEEHGELTDLDGSIDLLHQAAPLFDDTFEHLPDLYGNLSVVLRSRYRVTGVPGDTNTRAARTASLRSRSSAKPSRTAPRSTSSATTCRSTPPRRSGPGLPGTTSNRA